MMEIEEYINQSKQLHDMLLSYVEKEEELQDDLQKIINFVNTLNLKNSPGKLKELFFMITKMFNHHCRQPDFFSKIENLILSFHNEIKQTFSNYDIFQIFQNKLILLCLLENKILVIDETVKPFFEIDDNMIQNSYPHFFYPEIKAICDTKTIERIESDLLKLDSKIFDNFEQKRKKGENDTELCFLIRNDAINEFVQFTTMSNISLNSNITPSLFETNNFLIKKNPTLIEYAAFFGSYKIFQFLKMNNVIIEPSVFLYAIHSKSPEMIQLLEESKIMHINDAELINDLLKESIKCHHNDIVNYYIDNFLNDENEFDDKLDDYGFHYFNYSYFPKYDKLKYLRYACKYDYMELFNSLCESSRSSLHSLLEDCLKGNSSEILFILLNQLKPNRITEKFCPIHLKTIKFPSSVKIIAKCAFMNCKSLVHITISENVETIGKSAFRNCTSLKFVVIHLSNPCISKSAFSGCTSLKRIDFHLYALRIASSAFDQCTSLREINFPPSVNLYSFKPNAFIGCCSLVTLTIPSSVVIIDENAFMNCSGLKNVNFEQPASLEKIRRSAFENCTALEEITIPSSVNQIDEFAFRMCTNLKNVYFENYSSSDQIHYYAFIKCSSLNKAILPKWLTINLKI